MNVFSSRISRFPWTWALLALVAADVACRAHPSTAGFTPWIDGVAGLVSLGLVGINPKTVTADPFPRS